MNFNRYWNTRNIEMPMMISGITNENSMRKFAPVGGVPRQRSMPMAKVTPSGTARIMVSSDSRRLWINAACSSGFTNRDPAGAIEGWPNHHCRENPCHTLFDRPELKEKAIAIATGRIDHARYSHVAV